MKGKRRRLVKIIISINIFKRNLSIILIAAIFFSALLFILPVNTRAAECDEIEFSELSPTEATAFEISTKGLSIDEGVNNILFKISFENETARFYYPEKTENGDYQLYFSTSDCGGEYGIYYVTVYALYSAEDGGLKTLKKRGIEVAEEVTNTLIMGESQTTPEQMVKYYEESGYEYPDYYEQAPRGVSLEEFAQLYYDVCETEGVRAEAAWVQMCLETGYLNFSNLVEKEQFNFAGLGATGPGHQGFDFAEVYGNDYEGIRAGIIAHVQHLKCYAGDEGVNMLFEGEAYDPRWADYLRGESETLERLEGNWAVSAGYGMDLARGVEKLLNI